MSVGTGRRWSWVSQDLWIKDIAITTGLASTTTTRAMLLKARRPGEAHTREVREPPSSWSTPSWTPGTPSVAQQRVARQRVARQRVARQGEGPQGDHRALTPTGRPGQWSPVEGALLWVDRLAAG